MKLSPVYRFRYFGGKFRKENQETNLVAILFITNKFDSLVIASFSLKATTKQQPLSPLYKRWLRFNFQRCLLNVVMIFITDEFLRTRNSFHSCEAVCYAKLSRKKRNRFFFMIQANLHLRRNELDFPRMVLIPAFILIFL